MLVALTVFVAACLTALLVEEHRGRPMGVIVYKALASLGFVCIGLVGATGTSVFVVSVLVGLGLCWIGDLLLALRSKRTFLWGLVSFLLGHVSYAIAFTSVASFSGRWAIGAGIAGSAALPVVKWLRPHLGKMAAPVFAYVFVISVMWVCATGVWWTPDWNRTFRLLVILGATSFYLSDLFVARQRFVAPAFVNRLIGLPLYYGGQIMIAWALTAM